MRSEYFNEFVKIYNESVNYDNKHGKVDQNHAHELAKEYAEAFIAERNRAKFIREWEDFYYHMFD